MSDNVAEEIESKEALIDALKTAKDALCTARYLIQYNAKIGTPAQAGRWNKEYDAHYPECCNAISKIDAVLKGK